MKNRWLFVTLLAATSLMAAVFAVCQVDASHGERSFSAATPFVTALNPLGGYLFNRGPESWYSLLLALGSVAVLIGVFSRDRARRNFFGGALVALGTQFFLINQSWQRPLAEVVGALNGAKIATWLLLSVGCAGYIVSALFVARAVRSRPDFLPKHSSQCSSEELSWIDFSILMAIFAVGLFFRTYALNQIAHGFDGELACYMAGATSLKGMLLANDGVQGPWAPMGILYYLPIYLTTKLFGTTLLAVRLSSALVGLLTIFPLFILVWMIAGKRAGLFAAALFALDCLHIGWSRTDIDAHGATTWPTLLLCISLLKLARTRRLLWAILVAIFMGLSWHQYPSGQTAVGIPLIALALYAANNRGRLPTQRGHAVVVGSGVLLWILGLPLTRYLGKGQFVFTNPFTLTGQRAVWGGGEQTSGLFDKALYVATATLQHCADFAQGLFYQTAYMFHQEWVPGTEHLTSRTVDWAVMALGMVGLFVILCLRKRFESALLLAWIVAAVLPGVLSSHAYAKRLSTVFPAIECLAAIALSLCFELLPSGSLSWRRWLLRGAIAVSAVCYVAFSSYVWFSTRFWPYAEPSEIQVANEVKETIPPDTIIIADLGQGYEPSKMTFLLLDFLAAPENRPNLISFYRTEHYAEMIRNPMQAQSLLSNNWIYLWSKLRDQAEETVQHKDWKYVNFVMLDTFHNHPLNADLIQSATARCRNPKVRRVHSSFNTQEWKLLSITSVLCEVADFVS
jgi:hypothetical protein